MKLGLGEAPSHRSFWLLLEPQRLLLFSTVKKVGKKTAAIVQWLKGQ